MINNKCSTYFGNLVKLRPVLNADELPNTFDPEIILEFKFALLVQVIEIKFASLQVLE